MACLDFTEMPVWQLAAEIVKEVYELSASLSRCEDYALRGQVREAAVSITGNIAEGFGRAHGKDKSNFYLYARGSSYEVRSHLLVGNKVGYFTTNEISSINAKCLKVVEELNKIIKNLSSTPTTQSGNKP
jgi:four helix bundle protein